MADPQRGSAEDITSAEEAAAAAARGHPSSRRGDASTSLRHAGSSKVAREFTCQNTPAAIGRRRVDPV